MEDEHLVHNYLVERGLTSNVPGKVLFWDETMRDGEQTPGVAFTPEEKLQIATLLDDMGVPLMDVGIPVVSKEEARGVKTIANAGLDASIMAAARAVRKDVEACIDCEVDEVSVFIACSDLHLKYKLNMTREQVKEAAVRETEYAKDHGLKVSFVTEDTFRADLDYVVELYNACIEAGATRAVLCDTVGVMTPVGIRWFLEQVKPRFHKVQLSFHGHNDFGLAVANSLAAVEAGVEVPHTCVNGLGERSGNASFEELVMTLEALCENRTGIDVSRLYEVSRLVEILSGVPVGVNKPVVGYNAFSHESGIHADGVIKHTATYEPIQPERIGRTRQFIYGKHTGSASVLERLKSMDVEASKEEVQTLVQLIKEYSESKSKMDARAFIELFREREERRRGVTEDEFWLLAKRAGIRLPRRLEPGFPRYDLDLPKPPGFLP
ncbi:MAG TPA: homoaconitate hydratase [Thermoplasmata archaeon]|nr:homoaconitate hydratase [Thermoplasmata archaeon]